MPIKSRVAASFNHIAGCHDIFHVVLPDGDDVTLCDMVIP
jgi:hypothetical protein